MRADEFDKNKSTDPLLITPPPMGPPRHWITIEERYLYSRSIYGLQRVETTMYMSCHVVYLR